MKKRKKMFAAFIDLEKAYDKVWRADLWKVLKKYGLGSRLLLVLLHECSPSLYC